MLQPVLEPKINFLFQPIVFDVAAIAICPELFIAWICRYSFTIIGVIYRLDDLNALLDVSNLLSIGSLIDPNVRLGVVLKKPELFTLNHHIF